MTDDSLAAFLRPTEYIDSDHPDIVAKARELTRDCRTDRERLERIYYFVREMPYDILAAFRDLAAGRRRASDVVRAGHAFCMGKGQLLRRPLPRLGHSRPDRLPAAGLS